MKPPPSPPNLLKPMIVIGISQHLGWVTSWRSLSSGHDPVFFPSSFTWSPFFLSLQNSFFFSFLHSHTHTDTQSKTSIYLLVYSYQHLMSLHTDVGCYSCFHMETAAEGSCKHNVSAERHFYFCTQVDAINSLLKGPVMAKACEETKHFYSDHSQPGTYLYLCVFIAWKWEMYHQLLYNRYTYSRIPGFYVSRVPPNRRLDGSLSLYYPQEHPGGPLEPAHLYQNPGGEPTKICGWWEEHTHTHVLVIVYSYNKSFHLVFILYRWKEPASPGPA